LLRPGDLIFFGSRQRCTHVGLHLGNGRYRHSSGERAWPQWHRYRQPSTPGQPPSGMPLQSRTSGCWTGCALP
jgi:cell wall-associated NlpC family hydrolase